MDGEWKGCVGHVGEVCVRVGGGGSGPICRVKFHMFSRLTCLTRAQPLVNHLNSVSADTCRHAVRVSQMLTRSRSEGGFCLPDKRERRTGAWGGMPCRRRPLDLLRSGLWRLQRCRGKCVRAHQHVWTRRSGGRDLHTVNFRTRANEGRRSCRVGLRAAIESFL